MKNVYKATLLFNNKLVEAQSQLIPWCFDNHGSCIIIWLPRKQNCKELGSLLSFLKIKSTSIMARIEISRILKLMLFPFHFINFYFIFLPLGKVLFTSIPTKIIWFSTFLDCDIFPLCKIRQLESSKQFLISNSASTNKPISQVEEEKISFPRGTFSGR